MRYTRYCIHREEVDQNKRLEAENARLRADAEMYRRHCEEAQTDNARLNIELEALKPKPVVETRFMLADLTPYTSGILFEESTQHSNLKLTFHDGVLVEAEVLG